MAPARAVASGEMAATVARPTADTGSDSSVGPAGWERVPPQHWLDRVRPGGPATLKWIHFKAPVVRRSTPARVDSRQFPAPRWRRRVLAPSAANVPAAADARPPVDALRSSDARAVLDVPPPLGSPSAMNPPSRDDTRAKAPSHTNAPSPAPSPKHESPRANAPAPKSTPSPMSAMPWGNARLPMDAPRRSSAREPDAPLVDEAHSGSTAPCAFERGAGELHAATRGDVTMDAPGTRPSPRVATEPRAALHDRSAWTHQQPSVSLASPEMAVDARTSMRDWPEPADDADRGVSEPRAHRGSGDETAAHHQVDRSMWPSVDDRFDLWPESGDSSPDRPMPVAVVGTDARRLEGRAEALRPAHAARVARTGTPPVPSSVARFPPSLSGVSARPEPSVRWPDDLADRWPELPEEPSRPDDRSAEEQLRAFERLRRLDAEQRGPRWNA